MTHGEPGALPPAETTPEAAALTVLVYSDDATIRRRVIGVLGKRPSRELPPLEYVEVATEPVVHRIIGAGGVDLAILDGEAWPAGGMGICRQLKDEIEEPPPVLILIGRRDDAWLANWSLAETVVAHPIDPPTLVDAVVGLLRDRHARLPAG